MNSRSSSSWPPRSGTEGGPGVPFGLRNLTGASVRHVHPSAVILTASHSAAPRSRYSAPSSPSPSRTNPTLLAVEPSSSPQDVERTVQGLLARWLLPAPSRRTFPEPEGESLLTDGPDLPGDRGAMVAYSRPSGVWKSSSIASQFEPGFRPASRPPARRVAAVLRVHPRTGAGHNPWQDRYGSCRRSTLQFLHEPLSRSRFSISRLIVGVTAASMKPKECTVHEPLGALVVPLGERLIGSRLVAGRSVQVIKVRDGVPPSSSAISRCQRFSAPTVGRAGGLMASRADRCVCRGGRGRTWSRAPSQRRAARWRK